jgi:hypothetical protein
MQFYAIDGDCLVSTPGALASFADTGGALVVCLIVYNEMDRPNWGEVHGGV